MSNCRLTQLSVMQAKLFDAYLLLTVVAVYMSDARSCISYHVARATGPTLPLLCRAFMQIVTAMVIVAHMLITAEASTGTGTDAVYGRNDWRLCDTAHTKGLCGWQARFASSAVSQSLNTLPIQHQAAQQVTQGSIATLQEPQPGSQSVMQSCNSQQTLEQGEGMNYLQP